MWYGEIPALGIRCDIRQGRWGRERKSCFFAVIVLWLTRSANYWNYLYLNASVHEVLELLSLLQLQHSQKHLSGVDYSVPSRVSLWLSFLLIFLSSWLGSEFTTEGLQSAAVTITFALSANIHLLHITPASQLPSVYALWRFLCLPPALLSKYVCPHPY